MQAEITQLEQEASTAVNQAKTTQELENLRVGFLGRQGRLTQILRKIGELPAEDRPKLGEMANQVKNTILTMLQDRLSALQKSELDARSMSERLDVSLPGQSIIRGKKHPITRAMEEVLDVFKRLGYSVSEGPEVEDDYHNFEALNIPKYHPSRDMFATFYIQGDVLLRTHTSPVQVRVMEGQKPPIKTVMPGRVYRRDDDITHSPVFYQVEGLVVDENITFGDLKGTLEAFCKVMFGKDRKVRFRSSYFPFTEPSAEIDVECLICGGKGCPVCKYSGWQEILGAGMVDPNVFKFVGYDPEKYTGFAFGMGVERTFMQKYGIGDIRLFFENDLRFLKQF
jgi:phenylalanyl-tRNA synthetase alpha chain